jgi:hydrogenase/urease accessory protein HupE
MPRSSLTGKANLRLWLGVLLLAVGLVFHLLAANAEGGRAIHYRHHVLGFFVLTAAAALLVVGLGRVFWRGRYDLTVLVVGALQTILGMWVYAMFSG